MALNFNADFNQLSTWLNQNLTEKNSIIPHTNTIPKITSKGIYFWFMHPDGYKVLSNFVVIEPITPRYQKETDGIKYDLVYLGTTGTGKSGNSNLTIRLNWHINQQHSVSSVKSGTLSTLRQGIGSLLSDDLIIPDTETKVNNFLRNHLKVYWIEYPNNMQLIDNDEDILIKGLKPLLNLKNNPNIGYNTNHNSTKVYKSRRGLVVTNSILRNDEKDKQIIDLKTNMIPNQHSVIPKNNSVTVNNGCIEFTVAQNQSAFEVIRNHVFNAKKYTIDIFETKKTNNYICTYYDKTSIPNKYFGNTDTNRARLIDNREPARWKVIQKTMIQNNIQEITIRLRPLI